MRPYRGRTATQELAMMRTTLTCTLTVALLAGCAPSKPISARSVPVDNHTARDSLDWPGSYEGTLPCADCPGIRTRLTLMQDGRYERATQYLDREPQPETVAGTFSWESDGSTIRLDASGDSQRYFIAENQVIMLYRDGTRPTGPLAPHYVLRRAQ